MPGLSYLLEKKRVRAPSSVFCRQMWRPARWLEEDFGGSLTWELHLEIEGPEFHHKSLILAMSLALRVKKFGDASGTRDLNLSTHLSPRVTRPTQATRQGPRAWFSPSIANRGYNLKTLGRGKTRNEHQSLCHYKAVSSLRQQMYRARKEVNILRDQEHYEDEELK